MNTKKSEKNEGSACLIFGNITDSFPVCREVYFGEDAYSRKQLASYMEELLEIRKNGFKDESGQFKRLVSLADTISADTLYEIGTSLFSTIDKYRTCGGKDIHFLGVEPSYLLRETSKLIYPEAILYNYHNEVPMPTLKTIGRSYQATSYAFKSTEELVQWISPMGASQDGIWFSLDDTERQYEIFSHQLTLFSFKEFISNIKSGGFSVEVYSAQRVSHIGFEFAEIFLNMSKAGIMDTGEKCINQIKNWLPTRYVPVVNTTYIDVIKHPQMFNFSGLARKSRL